MNTSETLFSNTESFQVDYESLKAQITREQEKNKFLNDENSWLREQLNALKRSRFGTKSERWESSEQLLFNEVEVESAKPDSTEETEHDGELESKAEDKGSSETEKKTGTKRGHRKPLPEHLPRAVVKIELPPSELFAQDGSPLVIIGWEKSEKLQYEPAKMSVLEIHRAKYGVGCGDYARTAPPVPSIIPKGIATSELLAAIAVMKYVDGLPLYRIEEIFKRHGVILTRGTMARWMVVVATALDPIINVLSDRWFSSPYVAVDETRTQVLKENGRKAESQSWMFVRSIPFGDKKVVLFDYNPSRSGTVATELFADYKGFVQCDGLASYDQLEKDGVIRLGCNMHSRRRFESAVVDGAASGKSFGEQGLEFYKRLYAVEEALRDKSAEERHIGRQEFAVPIWDELKAWSAENRKKVPKKSKIGNAFSYFDNEYKYLTAYLQDGRLEMDNGFTERAIRKFAIGRNAWLFSDSVEGAKASSTLYSVAVTARVNGVEPHKAFVKILDQIPFAKTIEDYEALAELILSPTT